MTTQSRTVGQARSNRLAIWLGSGFAGILTAGGLLFVGFSIVDRTLARAGLVFQYENDLRWIVSVWIVHPIAAGVGGAVVGLISRHTYVNFWAALPAPLVLYLTWLRPAYLRDHAFEAISKCAFLAFVAYAGWRICRGTQSCVSEATLP